MESEKEGEKGPRALTAGRSNNQICGQLYSFVYLFTLTFRDCAAWFPDLSRLGCLR